MPTTTVTPIHRRSIRAVGRERRLWSLPTSDRHDRNDHPRKKKKSVASRDKTPQPACRSLNPQMQTIVSLVSANFGMALVPKSVSNLQRTGVAYVELAGNVPLLETGLAWREGGAGPVLGAFLGVVDKLVSAR